MPSPDPGYLTHPHDLQVLHNAFRTAQSLVHNYCATAAAITTAGITVGDGAAVKHRGTLRCVEVVPGPLFGYARTRAAFDFYARMMATTYFHACGTCPMSGDDGKGGTANDNKAQSDGNTSSTDKGDATMRTTGVVDQEFRIIGLKNVRVCDASVIPAIPSSPIQAVCMALGEGCGQLILSEV